MTSAGYQGGLVAFKKKFGIFGFILVVNQLRVLSKKVPKRAKALFGKPWVLKT
jgi:hypothetical protein